jgi:glycosyltransferase involved in cell wall biosynthesis
MCLPFEGVQQPAEFLDPVHGRDDKVESHGRTLTPVPLVSVLMSVHNDAAYIDAAVQSVLSQTLSDFELVVIDDESTDGTTERLAAYDDNRVRLERNSERAGLAASLNYGLELAQGRYVARLDADDVAVPERLEQQVAHIRSDPELAVVGSAVVDLDEHGRRGRRHVMPSGARPLRWLALFSSPFFHPTVLVDREALETHELRYDPDFLESEDYDLWTRLFEFADGDNLHEPLVLKRVHAGQASQRRRDVQESFQRRVALREIGRVAPDVNAEAAWRVGARRSGGSRKEFLRVLRAFERRYGSDWSVRNAAVRALLA